MSWMHSDSPNARFLATCYMSLSKVLHALRRGPLSAAARGAPAPSRLPDPHLAMQHVPYRDSPLTKWLHDTLSSSRHLLVLATVSWAAEAALPTLSFVSRFRTGSRMPEGGLLDDFLDPEADAPQRGSDTPPRQRSPSPSPRRLSEPSSPSHRAMMLASEHQHMQMQMHSHGGYTPASTAGGGSARYARGNPHREYSELLDIAQRAKIGLRHARCFMRQGAAHMFGGPGAAAASASSPPLLRADARRLHAHPRAARRGEALLSRLLQELVDTRSVLSQENGEKAQLQVRFCLLLAPLRTLRGAALEPAAAAAPAGLPSQRRG